MVDKFRIFFIPLIYFLFHSLAFANSYAVHCPNKIEVKQIISTLPSGWRSMNADSNHFLSNITLHSGNPEEMASLKPESSKNVAKWTFSAKDEIYIVCGYNQTNIQLTQRLYEHTIYCQVKFDSSHMGPQGPIPQQIECITEK